MFNWLKKPSFAKSDLQRWAAQGVVSNSLETDVMDVVETAYPKIVQEIHHEFMTAGDRLLEESIKILDSCAVYDKQKASTLKEIGFTNTPQVKSLRAIEEKERAAKAIAKLVNDYRVKYPAYKFITEEMVKKICQKYSLVCGDISLYKGFVPEKNLRDIKVFKSAVTVPKAVIIDGEEIVDISKYTEEKHDNYIVFYNEEKVHCFQQNKENYDGVYFYGGIYKNGVRKFSNNIKIVGLQICAPIKDMETEGMNLRGYKLEKNIPDPVVLQPIQGGYLIVTAWGDEASDPLVANEQMN